MTVIGGLVFMLVCVFGGYMAAGGSMAPILHSLPFEFAIIGGSAAGTFVMANSMHSIKHTLGYFKKMMKGSRFHKQEYIDLLCLLYYLARLANTKGPMALEAHIEKPSESPAFGKFPAIASDEFAVALICDYLRMVSMNSDDPHQIEDIFGRELKKVKEEEMHPSHSVQSMADALPALGIVAAVMGVIKTMSHINEPPSVLGAMIGGALVGTFLGVLLAYGMAGPMASKMKAIAEEEARYYETIKAVIVTHLHGNAPQVSVEAGRKSAPSEYMPTFQELEAEIQKLQI
jgi:chemotaxis protein MotA